MKLSKIMAMLFTAGTVITYGSLAFVGMFQFSSLLFLCGTAFVFSGLVEWSVYYEKIMESLKSFSDKNYVRRSILRKKIQENNIFFSEKDSNLFLYEYFSLSAKILELQSVGHDLSHEQQHEIPKLKKQLNSMEDFLLVRLKSGEKNTLAKTRMEESVDKVIEKNKTILNGIQLAYQKKQRSLHAARFFSIGAGAGSYFATLGAVKISFVMFNIALAGIPGGIVFSIALLGAVGYGLSLYQSILEVVKDYTLSELIKKIKTFFKESSWSKRVAMVLVVAFSVFAVVATAGTWLRFTQNGASLVPMISKVAVGVQVASVVLMSPLMLIYTLVNSCDSFARVSEALSNGMLRFLSSTKNKWVSNIKSAWKEENFMQFINPFRLLAVVIDKIIFTMHLVASALASDRFPEKVSSTLDGAAIEAMTDAPAFFEEHKKPSTDLMQIDNKHDNHSHGVMNLFLLPTRLLGVAWELLLGNAWYWGPRVTVAKALKKFFGSHDHVNAKNFTPHGEWTKQVVIDRIDAHIDSYGQSVSEEPINNKLEKLRAFKKALVDDTQDIPDISSAESRAIFSVHRSSMPWCRFFKTNTEKLVDELEQMVPSAVCTKTT